MTNVENVFRNLVEPTWYGGAQTAGLKHFPRLGRSIVFDRPSLWLEASKSQIEKLVSELGVNWDGYGGKPVNFLNAHFALKVLDSVCLGSTPAPSIVPGSQGDLQIEWHTDSLDVELHVIAPNHVNVSVIVAQDDGPIEEISLELTNDFTQLAVWVRLLSEDAIVAQAAAAWC